jgi:hypothetical protein
MLSSPALNPKFIPLMSLTSIWLMVLLAWTKKIYSPMETQQYHSYSVHVGRLSNANVVIVMGVVSLIYHVACPSCH